ncbi:ATP-binding protein [Streptomyces sp. ODS28]|uniref:ATP-binding protein n=1 Tax=Streptomyces sp. ODS28 TaxID=3136688 RepID=UPI0031E64CD4
MGTEGSTVLEPLGQWQGLPPLEASAVSGSASCSLPPRYEAVRSAREFTRSTLHRWGLGDQFDGVALVVSELVTNALRHGLTGAGRPQADGEPPVRLHLVRWSARLVCAVRDPSEAAPETAEPDEEFVDFSAESGRGLHLVECFSDDWGWHPLTGALCGKVVWALFRVAQDQD